MMPSPEEIAKIEKSRKLYEEQVEKDAKSLNRFEDSKISPEFVMQTDAERIDKLRERFKESEDVKDKEKLDMAEDTSLMSDKSVSFFTGTSINRLKGLIGDKMSSQTINIRDKVNERVSEISGSVDGANVSIRKAKELAVKYDKEGKDRKSYLDKEKDRQIWEAGMKKYFKEEDLTEKSEENREIERTVKDAVEKIILKRADELKEGTRCWDVRAKEDGKIVIYLQEPRNFGLFKKPRIDEITKLIVDNLSGQIAISEAMGQTTYKKIGVEPSSILSITFDIDYFDKVELTTKK